MSFCEQGVDCLICLPKTACPPTCIFNLLLCIFLFCRSFSYLSNTPTYWYWDSSANQIISVVALPTSATSQKYKSHESSLFCTNQIGRPSTKLLKNQQLKVAEQHLNILLPHDSGICRRLGQGCGLWLRGDG